MRKKKDKAVCKRCGKTLVGISKTGLCEACFNKDAGLVAAGFVAMPALVKIGKKAGPKILTVTKLVWNIVKKV